MRALEEEMWEAQEERRGFCRREEEEVRNVVWRKRAIVRERSGSRVVCFKWLGFVKKGRILETSKEGAEVSTSTPTSTTLPVKH